MTWLDDDCDEDTNEDEDEDDDDDDNEDEDENDEHEDEDDDVDVDDDDDESWWWLWLSWDESYPVISWLYGRIQTLYSKVSFVLIFQMLSHFSPDWYFQRKTKSFLVSSKLKAQSSNLVISKLVPSSKTADLSWHISPICDINVN